jgi:hypothetical protein
MAERVGDLRDDIEDEQRKATEETMDALQSQLRLNIRRNDSVARRVLVNDVRKAEGETYVVDKRLTLPEFAKYVEHGTGQKGEGEFPAPSNPPYQAIRRWMRAKGVRPKTGDFHYSSGLIAQSIAEEGTMPHPFIDPAWYGRMGWRQIYRQNKLALRRALRRM